MMKNKILLLCIGSLCFKASFSQPDRWQQRVKYTMNIDMNVQTNQFTGKQSLEYSNNSPDTLTRVFYHLYFNAFQPNSMMDTRSRILGQTFFGNRQDWDPRVKDRILNLKPDEIGYHKILSLKMNGRPQQFVMQETILEVKLDKPILPKSKVVFEMEFESQVPLQVRRSGRDNPGTKVRYSMSQWYPKICEYDYEGWHPTPYVAREFYGVWGDFDVTINIDKSYLLGGTGYLQNADQIGFGYEKEGVKVPKPATNKLSWHFIAPNVHDFMWAADPEFIHKTRKVRDSLVFHLLYKTGGRGAEKSGKIFLIMRKKPCHLLKRILAAIRISNSHLLMAAMEEWNIQWPHCLQVLGHGFMNGCIIGIMACLAQMNPNMHGWMKALLNLQLIERRHFLTMIQFCTRANYSGYYSLVKSGREEPLTTHADHFNTNLAYGNAVYSKGCVFLSQLGYIAGEENLKKIMLEYYRLWRFKHPNRK